MKNTLILSAFAALLFASCGEANNNTKEETSTTTPKQTLLDDTDSTIASNGVFIPIAEANTMIKSYLNSVNYPSQDSSLHSLIVDANALRAYLNGNTSITKLKLMFAHTQTAIAEGYCGYKPGALTIILAGYDDSGNYVYRNAGSGPQVMDNATACPSMCPTAGSAISDTLPNP